MKTGSCSNSVIIFFAVYEDYDQWPEKLFVYYCIFCLEEFVESRDPYPLS